MEKPIKKRKKGKTGNEKMKEFINAYLNSYYDEWYWNMRFKLYKTDIMKIKRYLYLYCLKRMEAKNNAALGTRENGGAAFKGKPHFPHGIKGIFIAADAQIGENVTIYQQVTIGVKNFGDDRAPIVGNNVIIGAGAKIIGPVVVGNNVAIGANAVVVKDVPEGCTVVGNPGRIIMNQR
ncbi:MAG: serine acetyltransferase [Eubacteriales bacterium]|nr:serine acetyltransferase [Eubacteriales bacterium]